MVTLAVLPLMMLFLGLGFAVAFYVVWRNAPRKQPAGLTWIGYPAELTWLVAPLVVIATFAGISAGEFSTSRFPNPQGRSVETPIPTTPRLPELMALPTGMTAATGRSNSTSHRPAWIDQASIIDGECQYVVLSSQQYSTREEAEAELSRVASDLIRDDLQKIRPGSSQSSWRPSIDAIRRLAIKQQYVEAVERDFGSFFHPMYRVWWQVELSPEVRTGFLPSLRQGLTISRVRGLGVVVSSVVLLASLLAMYRRLDVMSGGTQRGTLAIVSGVISLTWLTAIRFAFNHWL